MQLSPHFTLDEFIRSITAQKRGIDNSPTPEHLANLRLTAYGMEVVRKWLGKPIIITSAYRSPALNKAVGGTATSAHPQGLACDFYCRAETPYTTAKRLEGNLPYDQLILETGRSVVHISFDPRLRGMSLTQRGGPGSAMAKGIVQ